MKNKLTEKEQQYIISRVLEMRHLLESERTSKKDKIEHYTKHIRAAITQKPDDKHRSFYIEKLKQEIALLDGSFDEIYVIDQDPESKSENGTNISSVANSQELRQLISSDEIEEAIEKLLKLTENSEELHQEVVQFSNRFVRNNKKIRTGVADRNETDTIHNKIIRTLLFIVNKI